PQRSPCSTDSSRKPGASPTNFRNAETGVSTSASTSRHTGTTVWSRAKARKASLSGFSMRAPKADASHHIVCAPQRIRARACGARSRDLDGKRAEEAGALARVARALALLLDDDEHDVAVAVVVRLAHPLAIPRGLSLAPQLLS